MAKNKHKKNGQNGNGNGSKKKIPRKCNLTDPGGAQIKACNHRAAGNGMYCQSCDFNNYRC